MNYWVRFYKIFQWKHYLKIKESLKKFGIPKAPIVINIYILFIFCASIY